MEKLGAVEGSLELYTFTMPPNMVLCTDSQGVAKLVNRHRMTVGNWVRAKKWRSFNIGAAVVIPLVDVANSLGVTETQLYNIALAHKLPLWHVYEK